MLSDFTLLLQNLGAGARPELQARRMREFQQNASASQSNDLHARLCAENIIKANEMDPEVFLYHSIDSNH